MVSYRRLTQSSQSTTAHRMRNSLFAPPCHHTTTDGGRWGDLLAIAAAASLSLVHAQQLVVRGMRDRRLEELPLGISRSHPTRAAEGLLPVCLVCMPAIALSWGCAPCCCACMCGLCGRYVRSTKQPYPYGVETSPFINHHQLGPDGGGTREFARGVGRGPVLNLNVAGKQLARIRLLSAKILWGEDERKKQAKFPDRGSAGAAARNQGQADGWADTHHVRYGNWVVKAHCGTGSQPVRLKLLCPRWSAELRAAGSGKFRGCAASSCADVTTQEITRYCVSAVRIYAWKYGSDAPHFTMLPAFDTDDFNGDIVNKAQSGLRKVTAASCGHFMIVLPIGMRYGWVCSDAAKGRYGINTSTCELGTRTLQRADKATFHLGFPPKPIRTSQSSVCGASASLQQSTGYSTARLCSAPSCIARVAVVTGWPSTAIDERESDH